VGTSRASFVPLLFLGDVSDVGDVGDVSVVGDACVRSRSQRLTVGLCQIRVRSEVL
jgi:hypothetical protein